MFASFFSSSLITSSFYIHINHLITTPYLIEINLSTKFRVLLDILQEHRIVLLELLVDMRGSPLLLGFGCVLPLRRLIAVLFLEVLQFPESVLLALAELGVGLFHEDYRRHLDVSIVLDVVQLHQVDSVQVKA
jgi:hypothetical protein